MSVSINMPQVPGPGQDMRPLSQNNGRKVGRKPIAFSLTATAAPRAIGNLRSCRDHTEVIDNNSWEAGCVCPEAAGHCYLDAPYVLYSD